MEKGPLYNLHHHRDINGKYRSIIQKRRCRTILNETIYSYPYSINRHESSDLRIATSSGKWLHGSLDGHEYDRGLADGMIEIFKAFDIQTAVDVGCGPGWYVEDLMQYGMKAFGIDGNPNVISQSSKYTCAHMNCSVQDLTVPITNPQKAEGLICIEVCEHIPCEKERILIDNIISFDSRVLIISWASIDQKGDGHVNCKEQAEVIDLFESYSYVLDREKTAFLRSRSELWWIKNNVLVFLRVTSATQ